MKKIQKNKEKQINKYKMLESQQIKASTDLLTPKKLNQIDLRIVKVQNKVKKRYTLDYEKIRYSQLPMSLIKKHLWQMIKNIPPKVKKTEKQINKYSVKQQWTQKQNEKRKLALELLNKGAGLNEISLETGLKHKQVNALKYKIRKGKKYHYEKSGPKQKLTSEDKKEIKMMMLIPQFQKLSVRFLRKKFLERQNLPLNYISNETFRVNLRKTHGYKRGTCVGYKVNSEEEINHRYNFALWWVTYHYKDMRFIFIDEQSYNIVGRAYYGWALKGKPFHIQREVRLPHSLSLIAAITNQGLICFKIFVGTLTSYCFTSFVLQCMQQLQSRGENWRNYCFVWDKAGSHYLTYCQELKKQIFWLVRPTQSYDVMPIEKIFSVWRRNVCREELEHQDGLVELIILASRKITPKLCQSCINYSIKQLQKCIKKEEF